MFQCTQMSVYTHDFLSIKDIIYLSRTNRESHCINIYSLFKKRLIIHISIVCIISTGCAKRFLGRVLSNGGMISGSTILQILHGENYNSDINIYLPFDEHRSRNVANDILEIDMDNAVLDRYLYDYRYDPVSIYDCKYDSVQLIVYNKQFGRQKHNLATENFDMSILMNSFGDNFEIHNQSVLSKKGIWLGANEIRLKKYVERGYQLLS
jgi:hypothetical protein